MKPTITSYKRKRVDDVNDDDDAYDDAGMLKDGRSIRVPISFVDAYHRAQFKDVTVHDGLGSPAGRRPGFVYGTTLARPVHHALDAYVKWPTPTKSALVRNMAGPFHFRGTSILVSHEHVSTVAFN